MTRPDYQQRVIDEQAELNTRLQKLIVFLEDSPVFDALSGYDKALMYAQREAMVKYNHCLVDRIARFG